MINTSLIKNINKFSNKKSKNGLPMKSRMDIVKENKFKKVRTAKITKGITRSKIKKVFLKIALVIVGLFAITTVFGGIYVLSYLQAENKNIPSPDNVFPVSKLATEIYDRNGTLLYRLFNDQSNSDKVDIKEIPDVLKASFLAAEDGNFYEHGGFNPEAITRCALNILRKKSECGASTITQQLIKLTTKQSQQTVQRKIDEILYAVKVEHSYNKDQILEMYLRVTSYGSNLVGVKTAAKFYFGVSDLRKLTLAQSTILAAIVNNPVSLSPTLSGDPQKAQSLLKDRQSYILDQLSQKLNSINAQLKKNNGDPNAGDPITQQMIDDAKKEVLAYKEPTARDIKAGHFINYVIEQLQKRNYKNGDQPFTLSDLQTGGYRVTTSLDYNLQQIAEKYVGKAGNDYKYWNMHNAAVMTTKPSTGEVITMVGSKAFNGQSEGCDPKGQHCQFDPEVNVLTSLQSPGSTNKPFGYYEAFKEGKLFPGSFLPDIPIKIGPYEPKNWNGGYIGFYNTTVRDMLRQSRNIPALTVVQLISVNKYLDTVKSFGYTTYTGDYGPSVILGGADILPIEHVQAYSVFANGGDYVEVNPILKISDSDNKAIYAAKPQRKPVGDPQAVWLLNQTLYRLDSLGASIAWDDRDIAGKTGTTENNRDGLIMMYSPDFVTLGWAGNNNNEPMDQNNGWPVYVVIPWVKKYMNEIGTSQYFGAKTKFQRPGYVYQGGGDCDDQGNCLGVAKEWLIQGREPARGDVQKKKVVVCTDQVDHLARPVDIAIGLSVEKIYNYYKEPVTAFQGYLDDFVKGKDITNGGPQASCTGDRTGGGGNGPFFKLTNVSATTTSINIQGGIYTSNGSIANYSFYLDNKQIPMNSGNCIATSINVSSFNINCNISSFNLDNGTYQFKGTATDTQSISNSLAPSNIIVGETVSSNFTFTLLPLASLNYTPAPSQITFKYNFPAGQSLSNIRLCEIKDGVLIRCDTSVTSLGGGNYTYSWTPSGGDSNNTYNFYITATTPSGLGIIQSGNSSNIVLHKV